MTYAEAVAYLSRETGWQRADVKKNPTSAGWKVMERVWEACRVVEAGER